MRKQTRWELASWWQRRRAALGLPKPRQAIAAKFGTSGRTISRYEHEGPPPWYELALVGWAVQGHESRPEWTVRDSAAAGGGQNVAKRPGGPLTAERRRP